jgi:type IV conjugative transfer system protein TraL
MTTMELPRYLDEPERFLCWTVDEVVVMFLPMVLGLIWHVSGIGLLVGFMAFAVYQLVKNRTQGFLMLYGFCYWHVPHGLTPWRLLAPSWVREIIG